ncbi:hypothetical protein PL263_09250 [Methylomonas sp. EFPC3]|uniref:hypothetical protein n=1 Tax=Methylomonas TaxID=416 RepID=UPI001125C419|nr:MULTISPECIES: hypothetical protein [Methylomonas]TPQ26203.1 hypothetical protein C2U68_12555 [Methylomonas koyamae]WFP52197.1 hypothetical protein PL263_09250 [Methylomonas sp. EFPC3]
MKIILQLLVASLVLPLLWMIISSPILFVFFRLARIMRRRAMHSGWIMALFASVFSLIAAPVPTPIITVFIPFGLALTDSSYYHGIFHGPMTELWRWIVPSLVVTFAVSLAAIWRYLRSPDDAG